MLEGRDQREPGSAKESGNLSLGGRRSMNTETEAEFVEFLLVLHNQPAVEKLKSGGEELKLTTQIQTSTDTDSHKRSHRHKQSHRHTQRHTDTRRHTQRNRLRCTH